MSNLLNFHPSLLGGYVGEENQTVGNAEKRQRRLPPMGLPSTDHLLGRTVPLPGSQSLDTSADFLPLIRGGVPEGLPTGLNADLLAQYNESNLSNSLPILSLNNATGGNANFMMGQGDLSATSLNNVMGPTLSQGESLTLYTQILQQNSNSAGGILGQSHFVTQDAMGNCSPAFITEAFPVGSVGGTSAQPELPLHVVDMSLSASQRITSSTAQTSSAVGAGSAQPQRQSAPNGRLEAGMVSVQSEEAVPVVKTEKEPGIEYVGGNKSIKRKKPLYEATVKDIVDDPATAGLSTDRLDKPLVELSEGLKAKLKEMEKNKALWGKSILPEVGLEAHLRQKKNTDNVVKTIKDGGVKIVSASEELERLSGSGGVGVKRRRPTNAGEEEEESHTLSIRLEDQNERGEKVKSVFDLSIGGLQTDMSAEIMDNDTSVSAVEHRKRINRASARKSRLRKQAYQSSLEIAVKENDMFRMIADKAVDIITVHNLDPGATYRYVSPSMKKFTGWDPKELIGRSPYELIYKDDTGVNHLAHRSVLVGGYCSRVLTRLQKKDGSYTWVECTSSRGKDCIIVISRDVSSRTKTVIKDSVITRDYDSSSMTMDRQE